jgi:hypothetical protein
MPLPRPSRLLAAGAVTAGAALFGTALGGIATVDGELQAASVRPAAPLTAADGAVRVRLAASEHGASSRPAAVCPPPAAGPAGDHHRF